MAQPMMISATQETPARRAPCRKSLCMQRSYHHTWFPNSRLGTRAGNSVSMGWTFDKTPKRVMTEDSVGKRSFPRRVPKRSLGTREPGKLGTPRYAAASKRLPRHPGGKGVSPFHQYFTRSHGFGQKQYLSHTIHFPPWRLNPILMRSPFGRDQILYSVAKSPCTSCPSSLFSPRISTTSCSFIPFTIRS